MSFREIDEQSLDSRLKHLRTVLKTKYPSEHENFTNLYLKQFLISKTWNFTKAVKKLSEALQWRIDKKLNQITSESLQQTLIAGILQNVSKRFSSV